MKVLLPWGWDTPISWGAVQDYAADVALSRESRDRELREIREARP